MLGQMGFPGHPSTAMMCPISSLISAPSFPVVLTSTSTLQELQPHIAADSPGQGVPGSTHCQLIHCGKCAKGQDGGMGSIPGYLWEPAPGATVLDPDPLDSAPPKPLQPSRSLQHPPALGEAVVSLTHQAPGASPIFL